MTYDSVLGRNFEEELPRVLKLGTRRDTAGFLPPDTKVEWTAPLSWNSYRVRDDSIKVWLSNGQYEIEIRAGISANVVDGRLRYTTDGPVNYSAHLHGTRVRCDEV